VGQKYELSLVLGKKNEEKKKKREGMGKGGRGKGKEGESSVSLHPPPPQQTSWKSACKTDWFLSCGFGEKI